MTEVPWEDLSPMRTAWQKRIGGVDRAYWLGKKLMEGEGGIGYSVGKKLR